MIYNITYKDYKTKFAMKELVGNSFSFVERLKMRGIGCPKLIIKESHPSITSLIPNSDTHYCNIELRKKGIIVGFNSSLKIYAWCIPYHKLSIFVNSGLLSIHAEGLYIKAFPPFNGKIDKAFLSKLLTLKNQLFVK